MKKQILLAFCLYFTLMLQATVSKTVNVTAGGLSTALTYTELITVTDLTITGTIDARDFKVMRDNMLMLDEVDINDASIAAYTGLHGTITGNIVYPANNIPSTAFSGSSLTSITIPMTVTSIGGEAFYNCVVLSSVVIPSSVTSIGNSAFQYCTGLKSITIPSSVLAIGTAAFLGCDSLTSVAIPSNIPRQAFWGCSGLTSVTISESVDSIGSDAFDHCSSLTSITIPSSVVSIEDDAFSNCNNLNSVIFNFPSSLSSIGNTTFQNCTNLTSFTIPSSVISIGTAAFYGCKNLKTIIIPSLVTSIGNDVFYNCINLNSAIFNLPSSVTSFGNSVFYGCTGLSSVIIPSSVTSIGVNVFELCSSLTSIYAYSNTPIDLSSSSNLFIWLNTTTCTLYVPVGSKSAYQAAYQWKDFTNIEEMENTAIPTITNASINLYPNPITESFKISGLEGKGTMILSDLNGKAILSKQVISNESITLGTLPKGLYILKVITNEGTIERKVVKN